MPRLDELDTDVLLDMATEATETGAVDLLLEHIGNQHDHDALREFLLRKIEIYAPE